VRLLIGVELIVAALAGTVFLAAYARQGLRSDVGRNVTAVTAVMVAEAMALLALLCGIPVPAWLFAVAYAALDAVVVQRLYLLGRYRHTE
jgi:hypothetical protein